ncbi:MAG: aldo/keto reductase [Planctomycetales bacterium]|nr:aldo/keto reductase [Planctomycetales bacterium]
MKQQTLPGIDQPVSQLVFGCWGIASDFHWGSRDEQESTAAIHAALDAGINFFDTAEVYGDGASETLLGKALAGERQRVVLASKVHPKSMRAAEVIEACERSLARLGADYLDLFQTHWTDREIGIAESWEAMIRLQEQGKVRAIGVCNAGVGDMAAASTLQTPASNQLPYNLVWRAIEAEILPDCREREVGVLAYSPLMHGLLAGNYAAADDVPDGRARSRHFNTQRELARHGEAGCEAATFNAINAIREICNRLGRTMADVALAWVAAQPGVTCVIAGVKNAEQLAANVRSLANPLATEVCQELAAATDDLAAALGPNCDMWQGAATSRYR